MQNAYRGKNVRLRAESGKTTRLSFALEQELVESELWPKWFNFYKNLWIPHCQKLTLPYMDPEFKDVLFKDDKYVDRYPEEKINDWLIHLKTDLHINYWLKRYDEK